MYRYLSSVICVLTLMLILCGCIRRRQPAPQRSFRTEALLIGQDVIPPAWNDFSGPFSSKTGDDQWYTECTEVRFGVSDRLFPIQAVHNICRYASTQVAQRHCEKVYLVEKAYRTPHSQWLYRSPIADQTFFSCYVGNVDLPATCEWAGRYEEYFVTFFMRMTPSEASLADIETAVREIDARMAVYLSKPPVD